MQWLTLGAQWLVRLVGLFQIVTGLAFWLGFLAGWTPMHQNTGMLLVLGLWVLSAVALLPSGGRSLALLGFVWGALTVWLGMNQLTLLVGPAHWAIRGLHLLVGLGAMGLAEVLAKRIRIARAVRARA
jgi:hypothetical protein